MGKGECAFYTVRSSLLERPGVWDRAGTFCVRDASVQVPLERIKTIILKLDLTSLGYFIGQYEVVIETGLCPGETRIAGPYLVISLDHFDKKLRKDKKERAFAACDGLRDTLTCATRFWQDSVKLAQTRVRLGR